MTDTFIEDGPYHCCTKEGQDYFYLGVTRVTLKKSFHSGPVSGSGRGFSVR